MSKHRLLLDDDYEFLAFGLSCHLKDYRVAWMMNRDMKTDFIRKSLYIEGKAGESEEFSKFISKDEDNRLHYYLVSNQNEDVYLFREHKAYDFFLLVEGYIDIFDETDFLHRLQSIEGIQYISPMDSSIFHRLQYVIFED